MAGGIWMWAVLLLAVVALTAAGGAVVMAILGRVAGGAWLTVARGLAVLAVLASLLPGLAGLLGTIDGRSKVAAALRDVDPAYAQELREVGHAEARLPLQFGVGASLPLFALAVVALLVALPPTRSLHPG